MNGDYKHLAVRFYVAAKENKRKSLEAGRPVFDDREMVEIRIAGDPKTVFVAPAHDPSNVRDAQTNERLTWAQLHIGPYEAFKRGLEYVGSGTPLSELTFLTEGKRKELQALNIRTAEQLAALDGTNLQRLGMGGRALKTQAAEYINKATGSAAVGRIAQENEDLKARLAALEAMMAKPNTVSPEPNTVSPEPNTVSDEIDAASPFADWDVETLRVWYEDNGGTDALPNWKRTTFIKKCTDLNEQIRKQKEAA